MNLLKLAFALTIFYFFLSALDQQHELLSA